jgi:hypothetical protein
MRTFLFFFVHLFVFTSFASAEKRISISGEITACRLEKALDSIEEHYKNGETDFTLDLDSQGGDLGAAIAFIERLEQYQDLKIKTQVTSSWAQCSSACFPIFASGAIRKAYSGSEFFVHGLSWHKSESLSLFPKEDGLLFESPTRNLDSIVSLFFSNMFSFKSTCSLGENKYWLSGGKPNFPLAIEEYLAAVRRSSIAIAEDISPYIKGSANRKKTYDPKDLKKIDPEFLTSN